MRVFRIVLAFSIAPLIPSLCVGLYFLFIAPAIGPPMTFPQLVELGLPKIAYIVAVVAGVPAYLLMRRMRTDRWWHYMVGGALLGCLPALVLALVVPNGLDIVAAAIGAPSGALSGFAFWLIGIYGSSRPHAV